VNTTYISRQEMIEMTVPENEMKASFTVSEVKIRLIDEEIDGFLGWASCVLNGALYLNNISIRRSREAEIILSYPYMRNNRNQQYYYFNPITRDAKRVIDEAILGRLIMER